MLFQTDSAAQIAQILHIEAHCTCEQGCNWTFKQIVKSSIKPVVVQKNCMIEFHATCGATQMSDHACLRQHKHLIRVCVHVAHLQTDTLFKFLKVYGSSMPLWCTSEFKDMLQCVWQVALPPHATLSPMCSTSKSNIFYFQDVPRIKIVVQNINANNHFKWQMSANWNKP